MQARQAQQGAAAQKEAAFERDLPYYISLGVGLASLLAFVKLLYAWSGLFLNGRQAAERLPY